MATQTSEAGSATRPQAGDKPAWLKARVSMHRRAEQDRVSAQVLDRARVDFDDH
jgi:hypothetical protein